MEFRFATEAAPAAPSADERARILLMLALTKTKDPARIQDYFNSY